MDVIMNGLLIAATLFAGIYCYVLAGRVRALKSLDSGLGGSIVSLTRQIELARTTLEEARTASQDSQRDLSQLVEQAESSATQLRLLVAATKDNEFRMRKAAARAEKERDRDLERELQRERDRDRERARAQDEERDARPLAPSAPEDVERPAAPRRRDGFAPRLVALGEEPSAETPPRGPSEPEADLGLPKPRRTVALDGLLRRRERIEPPVAQTEEELIAALTAIAAGAER
jgi:hypothetical protein